MVNKVRLKTATTERGILDAYSVRHEVFVHEQHVPLVLEVDARDYLPTTTHFVGYFGSDRRRPVAAGRLLAAPSGKNESFWIGRVAVLPDLRGKGIGRDMILTMTDWVEASLEPDESADIFLDSQVSAVGFYAGLGFSLTDDREFMDAGIAHRRMFITVDARANL